MVEYNLKDLSNKNQALVRNSKRHYLGKINKTLEGKLNTLGIYFWLLFWVELIVAESLP